jgi:hypothetical protein
MASDPRITQERATQLEIDTVIERFCVQANKAVEDGYDLLCLSTGIAKYHLLNEAINGGPSLNDLFDIYEGQPERRGFMTFLDQDHPAQAQFALAMPMVRNEQVGYMIIRRRGPPLVMPDGSFITVDDLYHGDLRNDFRCDILAVDFHQKILDMETATQDCLVNWLIKEIKEKTNLSISTLFDHVGAGTRTGTVRHSLCALSLTCFKSTSILDGKLFINGYRPVNFKLQLTRPLNDGKESMLVLDKYQCYSTCDAYVKFLKERAAKRASKEARASKSVDGQDDARKKSSSDERKLPAMPMLSSSDTKPSGMLMPKPLAMPESKQPAEEKPPAKLPVMPMSKKTTTANMKQKTMIDFFSKPEKKARI